jgi:hypothetical protein
MVTVDSHQNEFKSPAGSPIGVLSAELSVDVKSLVIDALYDDIVLSLTYQLIMSTCQIIMLTCQLITLNDFWRTFI